MTSFQGPSKTIHGVAQQQEVFVLEERKVETKKVGRRKKIGGLSLGYLLPLLELVCENRRFTDIYYKSGFRFKRSLLNYLNFCVEKKLITKTIDKHKSNYIITEAGRMVLGLLR